MPTWERKHPCPVCKVDPVFVRSYVGKLELEQYRVQCVKCSRATTDYLTMTVAWMDWEDGMVTKAKP